jgi:hypothetical protein
VSAPTSRERPEPRPKPDPAKVLAEKVFAGGRSKPFAELTTEEVQARGQELRASAGFGPTARVLPVAMAWMELGREMVAAGAKTVADLDPAMVADRAEKLWIVPPGGTLLP